MTGFTRDWLALRAPFDAAARSRSLAATFFEAVVDGGLIVDLGSGTGENLRYLRPFAGPERRWRLVEADPTLLAHAPMGPGIEHRQGDLEQSVEDVLCDSGAVTASAFLDLISAPWADRLAQAMAQRRLPGLFALNYDGRIAFDPRDPGDATVVDAFNLHQRTDKGFGPALGPRAIHHLRGRLRALGAAIATERSDWTIAAADTAMTRALVDGMVAPAIAMAPEREAEIAAWAVRRRHRITDAALAVQVGHRDLLVGWV